MLLQVRWFFSFLVFFHSQFAVIWNQYCSYLFAQVEWIVTSNGLHWTHTIWTQTTILPGKARLSWGAWFCCQWLHQKGNILVGKLCCRNSATIVYISYRLVTTGKLQKPYCRERLQNMAGFLSSRKQLREIPKAFRLEIHHLTVDLNLSVTAWHLPNFLQHCQSHHRWLQQQLHLPVLVRRSTVRHFIGLTLICHCLLQTSPAGGRRKLRPKYKSFANSRDHPRQSMWSCNPPPTLFPTSPTHQPPPIITEDYTHSYKLQSVLKVWKLWKESWRLTI